MGREIVHYICFEYPKFAMKRILILSFCLFPFIPVFAQFVHPGMLHHSLDFKKIRYEIKSKDTRRLAAWEDFQNAKSSQLSWAPKPISKVVVGFYGKPNIGATDFRDDGNAAYSLALRYALTGDSKYAKKSIEIINAWSTELDSITHDNRKLLVGMVGISFLNAAEILKHVYKKWPKSEITAFEAMVLKVWYPVIQDFQPGYNGNWDAAIAQTMLCIGIFTDRRDIFEKAYNQIYNGESNGAIDHYFNDWGQCQESGRDQGHVQMGLGFLTNVCEIAHKQGRDLYGAYDNRLALGYEYTSKYMLGEEVRYVKYVTFKGKEVFTDSISATGRGKFSPVYQRAYQHYHDRKGHEMPFTKRALERSHIEGLSLNFAPWATLTSVK